MNMKHCGFIAAMVLATGVPNAVFGQDQLLLGIDGGASSRVHRYDYTPETFELTIVDEFVSGELSDLDGTLGMAFGPDNFLYVSSFDTDTVYRFNAETGAPDLEPFVAAGIGGLNGPHGLAISPDFTSLYVASTISDRVLEYRLSDGAFLGVLVDGPSVGLDGPTSIVVDGGELFVAGGQSDTIHRFDANTGDPIGDGIVVPSGLGGLNFPQQMIIDRDIDRLLVAGDVSSVIHAYRLSDGTPLGNDSVFIPVGVAGLDIPLGMARIGNDLFVVNRSPNRIIRFDYLDGFLLDVADDNLSGGVFYLVVKPDADECAADITTDGVVDFNDLLEVISAWGACTP